VISGDELKTRQRAIRDNFVDNDFAIRVHRAISWIRRGELEVDDPDARFVFFWIGFNALYASKSEYGSTASELYRMERRFEDIVRFDTEKRIHNAIWVSLWDPCRNLLDNEYAYELRWRWEDGDPAAADWADRFEREKKKVHASLGKGDTVEVLGTLFKRLYCVRNQLFHGNATFGGEKNRSQITDGAKILTALLPLIVDLMMINHAHDWGRIQYPPAD